MIGDWYKRCHRCAAWTCPADRERNVCGTCGGDPRSGRERVGALAWGAAVAIAIPLSMPALAVLALGVSALGWAKGEAS